MAVLARARAGDTDAFAELWRRHYPGALVAAEHIASRPQDAEDIASETFANMMLLLASGQGPAGPVPHYLRKGVYYSARHLARSTSKERLHADVSPLVEVIPEVHPDAQTTERDVMRAALLTLSDRWRKVLTMRYVDQLRVEDVAAELKLTPSAATALTMRARAALRDAYVSAHFPHASEPECTLYVQALADGLRAGEPASPTSVGHVRRCRNCAVGTAALPSRTMPVDLLAGGVDPKARPQNGYAESRCAPRELPEGLLP